MTSWCCSFSRAQALPSNESKFGAGPYGVIADRGLCLQFDTVDHDGEAPTELLQVTMESAERTTIESAVGNGPGPYAVMLSARADAAGRGDACGALCEACGARDDNCGFCVEAGGGSLYRVLRWSEDRWASLKLSDALLAIAAWPHSGVNPSLGGSTCVSF